MNNGVYFNEIMNKNKITEIMKYNRIKRLSLWGWDEPPTRLIVQFNDLILFCG